MQYSTRIGMYKENIVMVFWWSYVLNDFSNMKIWQINDIIIGQSLKEQIIVVIEPIMYKQL